MCDRYIVLPSKYYYGDGIREDETGGAYGEYGRNLKCIQSFGAK
jgi:hypothetical protein